MIKDQTMPIDPTVLLALVLVELLVGTLQPMCANNFYLQERDPGFFCSLWKGAEHNLLKAGIIWILGLYYNSY